MRSSTPLMLAGIFTAMAMLVSVPFGTATATESDGQTFRAYFALPLGDNRPVGQNYQFGLQLRQGIRDTVPSPLTSSYDFTVVDFSFTGAGKIGGDVMGVDLVQMLKLIDDPTKLGQNGTGLDNPGLWIAGGVAGAAILCITKAICSDTDTSNKPDPCAEAFADPRLAVDCAPTFRER